MKPKGDGFIFKLRPNGRTVELPGEAVSVDRSLRIQKMGADLFLGKLPRDIEDIHPFLAESGSGIQRGQIYFFLDESQIAWPTELAD